MPIGNLLKSQSNEVYLALAKKGFKASDFAWEEVDSLNYDKRKSALLRHTSSQYYFVFDNHGKYYYQCSPSYQSIFESSQRDSWKGLMSSFNNWVDYLSREVNAPDLWAELPSETELVESTSTENDNSKFNEEESKLIADGMEEIKQYLLTAHKLDPELIEGQIKYLVESSERLGRKDWKNALIAVIFSIIIQGGVAGHGAQEIFQFVWTILQTVLIQKVYLP